MRSNDSRIARTVFTKYVAALSTVVLPHGKREHFLTLLTSVALLVLQPDAIRLQRLVHLHVLILLSELLQRRQRLLEFSISVDHFLFGSLVFVFGGKKSFEQC